MAKTPFWARLILWLANLAPRLTGLSAIGESNSLKITRYDVPITNLHPAWHNCQIAHLTDVHLHGPVLAPAVKAAFSYITDNPVEILAHTGDFWDTEPGHEAALPYLKSLRGTLATVAIPGNWEYTAVAPHLVQETYLEAGVTWLANKVLEVTKSDDAPPLCLAGLDSYREGQPDLNAIIGLLKSPSVLLMHEPGPAANFPLIDGLQLIMAGHTHGGQIRLPILPPSLLPTFSKPFVSGWYQTPAAPLYVGRGVGGHGAIRFCAPPELTIFTLKASTP